MLRYQMDHGVGVGLRPDHYEKFIGSKPESVNWVEVITENFFPRKGQPFSRAFQTLEKIRATVPVALHGVSLNLGSTEPLNPEYVEQLKQLVDLIDPFLVSDHLCWTGVSGRNLHDLYPLPRTEEAIQIVTSNILRTQDVLKRPILIENVSSYVDFEASEMPEWEFIREISRLSGCGLLLDVNNVFVNSVNHGFDPFQYIDAIPVEKVVQIHLAGHSEENGFLIDTHDEPVCQEVWDLYRYTIQRMGDRSTMIERDANIPSWSELESELQLIHSIRNERILHEGARTAEAF